MNKIPIGIYLLSFLLMISCENNKVKNNADIAVDLRGKCHLHGCTLKEDVVSVEVAGRGSVLTPPLPDDYYLAEFEFFPFANAKVKISPVDKPESTSLIDFYRNPTPNDIKFKDDLPQYARVLFCPMCRKERNRFIDLLHQKHPNANYVRFKTEEIGTNE